jgi:hypothetical protein
VCLEYALELDVRPEVEHTVIVPGPAVAYNAYARKILRPVFIEQRARQYRVEPVKPEVIPLGLAVKVILDFPRFF